MSSQNFKDIISQKMWEYARETWGSEGENMFVYSKVHGDYTYPRFRTIESPSIIGLCSEGVGTKMTFAEQLRDWSTIGQDLLAMVLDDIARIGAKALGVSLSLDIGRHDGLFTEVRLSEFMRGLVNAAKEARVPILDGETAELTFEGGVMPLIANASAMWTAELGTLIDGTKVKVGDSIIALPEEGFRSNGFTFLRKILEQRWKDTWMTEFIQTEEGLKNIAHLVMQPSKIYYPIIQHLLKSPARNDITGMIHVTGGGVPGKLKKYLRRSNASAVIDIPMPCISPLVCFLIDKGYVTLRDAMMNFNMGMGFLIITSDPLKVYKTIDHFFPTYKPLIVGTIVLENEKSSVSMEFRTRVDF